MNILATKLGNLDGLTEAISNKLSEELSKLTKELTNAKNVINKAETIQTKRQEIIEKQVKNVKEILGQSLRIEIAQVTDNNTLTDQTNTGGDPSTTPNPSTPKTDGLEYTPIVNNQTDVKDNLSPTPWSKSTNNTPVKKSGANPGYGEDDIMIAMKQVLQTTKWQIDGKTIRHKS